VKETERSEDRIRLPPSSSAFTSPSGRYRFELSTPDEWKSKHADARLFRMKEAGSELIWEGKLPQEYGPRFVLVAPGGKVLMLDEWINVKSRYAIVLFDPHDGRCVTHRFDAVQAAVGIPAAQIVRMAEHGWWIAGLPALSENGDTAIIPTAGKELAVDLTTGSLSIR
jgi:hypothetical protein